MANLSGTSGADSITGGTGDDRIEGLGGNDTLAGGLGNDLMYGGTGDDLMRAGAGNDTLYGGAGNDRLVAGAGRQVLDGGAGYNTLDLSQLAVAVRIEPISGPGSSWVTGTGGDISIHAKNVYRVIGTDFGDTIDIADQLVYEYLGGGGDDRIIGSSVNTPAYGSNMVDGGVGNDMVYGSIGDDIIHASLGNDNLDGNEGEDRLSLERLDGGSSVNLQTGRTSGAAGNDTLTSFEFVLGSAYSDTVTGTDHGWEVLIGNGGADSLSGGGGDDSLYGGEGNDTLVGGAGLDRLEGGNGNDTYVVGVGDVIREATGAAGGVDLVRASTGWTLAAHVEQLQLLGTAAISAVGNRIDNLLFGNGAANQLLGMLGDDTLRGGGGNDTLLGGDGNDELTGGVGADRFRFHRPPDAVANADRITDFVAADDALELYASAFVGIGPAGTLAASAFVAGTAALDAGDRVVYDAATGRLYFDADGSGAGAAVLFATVAANAVLTAADIVVI